MSLLIPDEGAPILLMATLRSTYGDTLDFRLHLYQNDYTPVYGTTLASFTESSFTGYSYYDFDPSKWQTPTIVSHRAQSVYDAPGPVERTNTGSAQDVYGYYVEEVNSGKCVWAERFATTRTLNTGDKIDLTAIFNGGTQT